MGIKSFRKYIPSWIESLQGTVADNQSLNRIIFFLRPVCLHGTEIGIHRKMGLKGEGYNAKM